MMWENINVVNVYYLRGNEKLFMGRLALKNHNVFFEYDSEFLKMGLELSPFKLPLKAGVIACADRLFDGLFGVFNDSLPDGWGRLLLDRKLMTLGVNPNELTSLNRLCYVGRHGMGALVYEPDIGETALDLSQHNNLDEIANECLQFQENDDDRFIDDLLIMNGSSAGARPKILISLIKDSFQITDNSVTSSRDDWIIKFPSSLDPKDIGSIEYAYHLMAKAAGLDVPEAKLFKSKKNPGYFGVKRFDRANANRVHMHTVSGLLHADHRIPSLDYNMLMKATLGLTKDEREAQKQFRQVVFNVLAHNRDDHAKNFSYLMDENGVWCVSPAYDLTFSSGPAGEHCTTVMGEGKNPKLAHLLKLADVVGIKKQKTIEIIDVVKEAVLKWQDYAKDANVSKKSSDRIQVALLHVLKKF